MPNQRRPKRAFKKRNNNNGKLSRDVAYLKSVINSELHSLTTRYQSLVVNNFGSIHHLSPVSVGTDNENRIGNSISPKYINAKLQLLNTGSATHTLRMIFFVWKDQSVPLVSSVLETSDPFSHYNKESAGGLRDRTIMVLRDRTYSLVPDTTSMLINIKYDLKMNRVGAKVPLHIKYNATQTTSEMNGIYILLIASSTSVNIDGSVKFSFYDN